jgi:hypothetical protein
MMEGTEQATGADVPSERLLVRPTVYIDTSVPSYLTSRPAREWPLKRYQWVTCLFWNAHGARFEMHVSRFVVDEVKAGDPIAAQKRIDIISALPRLEIFDDVDRLTALILKKTGLPVSSKADAEHVAIAATHNIDFLATWNCKHLANPSITPKVARACERAGFSSPEICTPEVILKRVVYGPRPSQRVVREQSCRARPAAQAISRRAARRHVD